MYTQFWYGKKSREVFDCTSTEYREKRNKSCTELKNVNYDFTRQITPTLTIWGGGWVNNPLGAHVEWPLVASRMMLIEGGGGHRLRDRRGRSISLNDGCSDCFEIPVK